MKIALGQFNASVGDIDGNIKAMSRLYHRAVELGTDVLVFPEMCLCGYPPEDLLLRRHFLTDSRRAIEKFAAACPDLTICAGFAEAEENRCFNSLAVLSKGRIKKIYHKNILPNYGVFDEKRYFESGTEPAVIEIDSVSIVLTICEDVWQLQRLDESLKDLPRKDMIVNISASPFHVGKFSQRQDVLGRCAKHFACPLAYCNLVGGQDELVFDGRSMFLDADGRVVGQAKAFKEDLIITDVVKTSR